MEWAFVVIEGKQKPPLVTNGKSLAGALNLYYRASICILPY